MSPQLPAIRQGGAEVLDKLLKDTVAKKQTPAIAYLATNAKEVIYANQEGVKVFGDESSGQIDGDTSESGLTSITGHDISHIRQTL